MKKNMKKTWNKPTITQLDVSEGTKAQGKNGSRSEGADNGHNRARS